jgi:ElaB/YqjD/DUF883 family membrane-anchored ribosome-binding protein
MEDTKLYLDSLQTELKRLKAETRRLRRKAAADRKKTEEIKAQIEKVQAENQEHLKRLGWTNLTEEELLWLKDNYNKEWPYFKPADETTIKKRYAERHKQTYVEPEPDPKYKGFEEYKSLNAWVNPYGKFYPVNGFALHDSWAWDWLENEFGKLESAQLVSSNHGSATETLENMGWVRVMTWNNVDTKFSFAYGRKLSRDQKDTLQLFCSLHNLPVPFDTTF